MTYIEQKKISVYFYNSNDGVLLMMMMKLFLLSIFIKMSIYI